MSRERIIVSVGAFWIFLFLLSAIAGGWLVSINNSCVSYEQRVQKQYAQNKNVYDNYFKKVKEASQVPDMYIDGLKEVFSIAMKGRYGEEGVKAVFQWIQEHNPQVDSNIYKKIQDIIEAGRNEFAASQRTLLDIKREYETYIGRFPASVAARWLRYPRIDLTKYDIVTSDKTEREFEQKKSEPLKLQ